jgi:hypothetical protein
VISTPELRQTLKSAAWVDSPFETLAQIAGVTARSIEDGRELTIRALNYREILPETYKSILDELTAVVGLYPYLMERYQQLSDKSALLHAAHTVSGEMSGEMNGFTLHSAQARILTYLMDGESVVLSAPTSFGKSLLIDLVISASDFRSIVLIVPTLALVEETRRRMARFSSRYSIITTRDQEKSEKSIFVLTQERYLSMRGQIEVVDFFAIDEFYKLSISEEGSRSTQLNEAFLHLYNTGAQFFMLGPSIDAIPENAAEILKCRFIIERFQTVVTELFPLSKKPSKIESLANLLDCAEGQSLIYCQSPSSTRKVLKEYMDIRDIPVSQNKEMIQSAEWTSRNYHDQWLVSVALKHGIGIHHGRLPRALARFMVRAFERGIVKILLCTSTLIEGVNTSAKNVIIYDNKIGGNSRKNLLDFFTFNNIRGRSGRMFQHFIGNVYYFDTPPQEELPFVDIPAVNPTDTTPSSLLIQMDEKTIPEQLRDKYRTFSENEVIPFHQLKELSGIEPEFLLGTAEYLNSLPMQKLRLYAWANRPQYEDIQLTSELIWENMGGSVPAKRAGISSAKMMTFWLWKLYSLRSVSRFRREMIDNQINNNMSPKSPDEAVENVLAFLRNWASFNYPKYLSALNDVVNSQFSKRGLPEANYLPFATQIEHLFQPTALMTLEEFGLPIEISQDLALKKVFSVDDSFQQIISSLRHSDLSHFGGNEFEKGMIDDFQKGIGVDIDTEG